MNFQKLQIIGGNHLVVKQCRETLYVMLSTVLNQAYKKLRLTRINNTVNEL